MESRTLSQVFSAQTNVCAVELACFPDDFCGMPHAPQWTDGLCPDRISLGGRLSVEGLPRDASSLSGIGRDGGADV